MRNSCIAIPEDDPNIIGVCPMFVDESLEELDEPTATGIQVMGWVEI